MYKVSRIKRRILIPVKKSDNEDESQTVERQRCSGKLFKRNSAHGVVGETETVDFVRDKCINV
jgi:hypothetical protein